MSVTVANHLWSWFLHYLIMVIANTRTFQTVFAKGLVLECQKQVCTILLNILTAERMTHRFICPL